MVLVAAGRGAGETLKKFNALVDELRGLPPAEREAAESRLREAYEVEGAVLALDMSGFSASVRRSGIIAHLCQIRRVQQVALPLIEAQGGEVVKCEADNILAVFADVGPAVQAAVAINHALAAHREAIRGQDAFGDTVNVAYKLGEDVARAEEILVTAEAWRRLGEALARAAEPLKLSISGVELHAWRIIPGAWRTGSPIMGLALALVAILSMAVA